MTHVTLPAPLKSVEARLLRAALRDDERERDRIIEDELAATWPFEIVVLAVAVAARRRFDERWDRRVIHAFARRFVAQAPGGAGFAVRDAEALLRGFTGDPHLLGATSEAEKLPELYYALLLALADDLELGTAEADQLLIEAVRETTVSLKVATERPEDTGVDPAVLRQYRRIHRRYLTGADVVPVPTTPPREPTPIPAVHGADGYPEPTTRAGRFLRSYLVGVEGPAGADVPPSDLYYVARATLVQGLYQYLPSDPDLREISALVRTTTETFPKLFRPMKAEYVIRILMGETDLPLDGITKPDIYAASVLLLRVMGMASESDDAVICPMIVSAERSLARSGKELTA